MSASTHNSDDNDPAGISAALRRDAQRIVEAPFDAALQRETMGRIRGVTDVKARWFEMWGVPMISAGAAAVVVIALILAGFQQPSHPAAPLVVEAPIPRLVPPVASVWSYEMALTQGDAAFTALLEHDAQTLLPVSAKSLEGLL